MLALEGQHSELTTKALVNFTPWRISSRRTTGVARRLFHVWSSVRMRTMLGLERAASARTGNETGAAPKITVMATIASLPRVTREARPIQPPQQKTALLPSEATDPPLGTFRPGRTVRTRDPTGQGWRRGDGRGLPFDGVALDCGKATDVAPREGTARAETGRGQDRERIRSPSGLSTVDHVYDVPGERTSVQGIAVERDLVSLHDVRGHVDTFDPVAGRVID